MRVKHWKKLVAFALACVLFVQTAEGAAGGGTVYADVQNYFIASSAFSDTQKSQLEKKILEMWDGHKTSIDITSLEITVNNNTVVRTYYLNLIHLNPRYFYVDTVVEIATMGNIIVSIKATYSESASGAKKKLKKFDAAVKTALSGVNSSWSEMEKALYLHDYLCSNCAYDQTLKKYTAYDALVSKKAICQGYALAYVYLLDKVGIKSQIVESRSINHAWNLVKIGSKYYNVDVTWDDPTSDMMGRACHTFFLQSTASFQKDGRHYAANDWAVHGDWNTSKATSKTYDKYFWKNVQTSFNYVKGYWYAYNDKNHYVCRYTCNGKTMKQKKKLVAIKDKWYVWDGSGYYYGTKFTKVCGYGKYIYYSTPKAIYRLDVKKNKSKKIYTLTKSKAKKGDIYGIFITTKGKLQMQLSKSDQKTGKTYTVKTVK